ncbi:MAG: mucoidy inhibitor MuiA family protein [Opitutaceae bacterium]|nr:mucoidy inhibitor MuiA family protein [Opitutaceae bacterium]
MKYSTLLAIAVSALVSTSSQADEIVASTTIQDIALFRDGALVTRQGTVTVPVGKSTIQFDDLPTRVDPTAIQANFLNQPDGLIRNAKIHIPENQEESDAVKALQNKLDATNLEKAFKHRIRSEATADITFAQTMRSSFSKEYGKINEGQSLTLEQAKDLASFVATTQKSAYAKIDAVEIEIKAIDERIEDIQKDLKEAIETDRLLASIAEVEIEMAESGEIEIALCYLVNSANWTPQYELRARPDEKTLDFGYFAAIWQNTGEDWSDVTLFLHTNQANRQGNVPVLYPLALRNQESYSKRSYSSFGGEAAPPQAEMAARSNTVLSPTALDSSGLGRKVAVSASTVSFQATIPGRINVPSSRESSAFKVLESSLEAEFWSEAVPRVQLDTYLRAKIRNTLDLPILPGQALAFVDGKLSSKVVLEKILPEEETELSLGTDANIIVKRREGSKRDTNSGFIDKTTTLQREYANEVINYHSIAHKIILVDQFPIAQNSKIEIRRKSPATEDVTIEDENDGIFKWEATLEPKEERTFTTAFDIIYPRDWNLYPEL